MCWHAEMDVKNAKEDDANDSDQEEDTILTHPSDASQWKALDIKFSEFGDGPRNIRLCMSMDGLNPFGNQSITHSTWPVFLCIYNLPPG